MADGDPDEVLVELDRQLLVGWVVQRQLEGIWSMFWEKSAIHAVPSACSR